MDWQFHFRNFDTIDQWFGVYHAGCVDIPWHDGSPRCWDVTINNNPMGGENSVYVPSSFVVNFDQWFKVILDGIKEITEIAMIIVTEGDDADAWKDAVSTAFDIGKDTVEAALTNSNADLNTLMANSEASFAAAAAAIGKTPDQIRQIGAKMGYLNFGFIAGQTFQNMIHNDNEDINDGHGWSIFRAPSASASNDYMLNHAFIQEGHLIIYWNSDDITGFWNPWS
jgi:hypothetical protein